MCQCETTPGSSLYVPWFIHLCGMTHSYLRNDSLCHDSFMCFWCLIHKDKIHHLHFDLRSGKWVMSHWVYWSRPTRPVTGKKSIWHTGLVRPFKKIMKQIWINYFTHKNESCHTHRWLKMDEMYFNCIIRMCQCDMPHLRTRNDKSESCHTHEWVKIDEANFNCIIRMCQCDMPQLRTRNDSFVCAHWLLHMVDMAHLYV